MEHRTAWAWPHLHSCLLEKYPIFTQKFPRRNLVQPVPLTTFFTNKRPTSTWLESCFSSSPGTFHWRYSLRTSQTGGHRQLGAWRSFTKHMSKHHADSPCSLTAASPWPGGTTNTGETSHSPLFSGGFLLHCHGWAAGLGCQNPPWWKCEHHSQPTLHSSWHWFLCIF